MILSLNADELIKIIKKAAVDAVRAGDPMAVKIGKVVTTNPLAIQINQKITLQAPQLYLTSAVSDRTVSMTSDGITNIYTVHRSLALGEKVLMLRCEGGQKFIIIDRLEDDGNGT